SKIAAGAWIANGFGKAAGLAPVRELRNLETPSALSNTLAAGTARHAVGRWPRAQPGSAQVRSVNAVVGEPNDGWALNDIRSMRVTEKDVDAAIAAARSGPVEEGSVGAGTGTVAFGWKGGIGTASRRLPPALGGWT